MNTNYSNITGVPLSLAVFLANDQYDYNNDPWTISTTTLMKPVRQLILGKRVQPDEVQVDILSLLQSRMGSAIHKGVEDAWLNNHVNCMTALGYPKKVIEKVVINPDPVSVNEDQIPVYLEQRYQRKIGKWTVTGQADFIGDGQLEDIKTTGVFTAMNNTKDNDYILQGSIYRWLRPDIITKDTINIQWIFTDWSKANARSNPKYPQSRHMEKSFDLMTLPATENWIKRKLALLEKYWDAQEEDIPECTDEELWRSEPTYKYYSNPDKTTGRSTKNFDNPHDAKVHLAAAGKGIIKTVPGQVKACLYCPGFSECKQKDRLLLAGDLQIT